MPHRAAAAKHASKLMIGLPSGRDEWRGNKAIEHIDWLKSDGGGGMSFWDAQLKSAAWRKPEIWTTLRKISGKKFRRAKAG
jgi:hypothetical protein